MMPDFFQPIGSQGVDQFDRGFFNGVGRRRHSGPWLGRIVHFINIGRYRLVRAVTIGWIPGLPALTHPDFRFFVDGESKRVNVGSHM